MIYFRSRQTTIALITCSPLKMLRTPPSSKPQPSSSMPSPCRYYENTVAVTCGGTTLYGHVVVWKVYFLIESRCRDVSRKKKL